MASNKLTDLICKREKPFEKPRKLSDGHGLYLFISPTGAKIWRVGYRQNGKEGTEVLGPYPLLSLADARIKRDEFRRKLLDGVDVKAKPKKSITFSDACTHYWEARKNAKEITENYFGNATRGLAMHLADIASTPVGLVTKEAVMAPLVRLDLAGKHVYAKRVRVWAGQVFDWCVEHGHCQINPAAQINPAKAFSTRPVEHHAALALSDVPDFLLRLSLERELQSVLACRLLALTWVRTGELRMMKWGEIEGDVWRIPKTRMKMKRVHLVPLPTQATALIAQLQARSRGGEYVFPSDRRIDRPMSENAVLYLIHRMGYKGRMTGHGWRGVASTWANEHGYPSDHIEMQLAHGSDDAVRGAYNHAAYLPQRRALLQDWADWLDKVDPSRAQG
jgi:integrase